MRLSLSILAGFSLFLTGCFGTSPPSRFYLLTANPKPPDGAASPGPSGTLGVFPTRVAEYLDRPQIVTFVNDDQVELDEYSRWAEPLGAGVTRVLSLELNALLPGWRVVSQPWDPIDPLRARVVVSVTALGWDAKGEARLEASWSLLSSDGKVALARGRIFDRVAASGTGAGPGVAAVSTLTARMAREIAAAVRELPPPAPER